MSRVFAAALLSGVSAFVLIAGQGSAQAAGFAIREQSAEGQGAAFAGIGAGGADLSSIFFNPATITLHDGWQFEADAALIVPYSRADDGSLSPAGALLPPGVSGDSGDVGSLEFVPATYASVQVNDRLYLGLSVNAPFGLSTKANEDWVGAPHGVKSQVTTYNISPMIGLKLSDELSVAAGVQVNYVDATLTSHFPFAVAPVVPEGLDVRVKGDDWGVGFTAGLMWQPTATTRIGLGFRSMIEHELEGRAKVEQGGATLSSGDATAPLDLPETVTLGIRQEITERATLLLGVEWANWSRFKTLTVNSEKGLAPIGGESVTPEHWNDSWFFSLGGEYRWSPALTLRAGVAYEDSGVPTSTRTPRVPDNNRYWVSVGASYAFSERLSFSVAYSHLFVEDGKVALEEPTPLHAEFEQDIDIVSLSGRVSW
ncbi:outer membrane protein transport protein [Kaustia mangrovi]|uniref:Outer membrane protein transport protein n=1 Tax=Kaustia mangrovi TaxID=2593653 RepID=A0A7S8HB44_9HYPH|nr:porin [Kaustia mangrovi]QPC41773.1 outer membrane protein transport protein [Kaustia mangrovi]